jgi:hypothetical protein
VAEHIKRRRLAGKDFMNCDVAFVRFEVLTDVGIKSSVF